MKNFEQISMLNRYKELKTKQKIKFLKKLCKTIVDDKIRHYNLQREITRLEKELV